MYNINDYVMVNRKQFNKDESCCVECCFYNGTNICDVEKQKEFHTCISDSNKVWAWSLATVKPTTPDLSEYDEVPEDDKHCCIGCAFYDETSLSDMCKFGEGKRCWEKNIIYVKKGNEKMNVKTIDTVNVMVTDNGTGDVTLYAFPDTEQGNKDAKGCFKACIKAVGIPYEESMYENGFAQGAFNNIAIELIASTKAGTIERAKPVDRMIHEYVRDIYDNKVGVFVAIGNCEDGYTIGWSKANINAGDEFDKDFGLKLAIQRANDQEDATDIPDSFMEFFKYFVDRCDRYYKQGQYKV